MASSVLVIPKRQMIRLLHSKHAFSDRFTAHMLLRNAGLEADLVDHLFNSSDKRLPRAAAACALWPGEPTTISQETLAETVGTTRSRVNFFMNKFKKLGFIEYDGGLKINASLLTVVVHA
jgi:CRP-like cAMP-binding protein